MPNLKPHAARILAVLLIVLTWAAAQPNRLSASAKADLASGFKFTKLPMPEPSEYPNAGAKIVRQVHPSLKRISAWISATGSSIALGDIDGDGLDNDYCFIDPRTDAILVGCVPGTKDRYPLTALNPGKLVDATMAPMGALICDLNEDGLEDILVYYWGRTPIAFLHQKGELSKTAFAPKELIAGPNAHDNRWFSCAVTQADFDGDGHKDLLVCNYFKDGSRILDAKAKGQEELHDSKSKSYNGGLKHFLLWDKGGYKEVKSNLSDDVLRGWTVAAASADINGDLLPEIYLANDLGPDRLLLNQSKPGALNFSIVEGKRDMMTPASSVLGRDSYKGMGVDFADVNNDGKFDIYVSNIAAEYGFMESHFLWLSEPQSGTKTPQYKQASEDLNLSRSGWGWDARLADFDNDGKLEAMQATGFLKGKTNRWPELQALGTGNDQMMHDARNWPSFKPGDDINGHEPNAFFVRAQDGRYYNITKEVGLSEPMVSRGIAIADVDGDGDLDFAVANQWEPSYFYRNDSHDKNKFLSLRLEEGPKNLTAVGAVAKLHYPDGRQAIAQVDGGSGHSGKRSSEIHFGLGDVSASVPVDLLWRDSQGKVHEEKRIFEPGHHLVHLGSEVKGN